MNYGLTVNQKGDALYETSNNVDGVNSWYSDYLVMTSTSAPWFIRGGKLDTTTNSGIFSFSNYWGGGHFSNGFRPVIAVDSNL
jgi:hypothetical protein